ncbi:hypothetical protein PYCC9005_003932 [Savitreella phatthalungensis]
MPKFDKIRDKRVLIIGGSSGIGFATAEGVIAAGGKVVIASSRQAKVDAAVAKLGASASGYTVDLFNRSTLDEQIKGLLEKATKESKLDHVVYTAGDELRLKPIQEFSIEEILDTGNIRFFGPIILGKYVKEYLNPGPASSVIFTTGVISSRPLPNGSVPNAYASGLDGLTRGLALDLAPIRVNIVSPGFVVTELWDTLPEEVRKGLFAQGTAQSTTGQIGSPENTAEVYLYFMRDYNATGEKITTDNGSLMK